MSIKTIFQNTFETSNQNMNQDLLSHNYRGRYDDVKYELISELKKMGYQMVNTDDTYKEILLKCKKHEIIVSLYNPIFNVTCIDIKINSFYLFPFNRPLKEIKKIFELLDHHFELLSKGGYNVN